MRKGVPLSSEGRDVDVRAWELGRFFRALCAQEKDRRFPRFLASSRVSAFGATSESPFVDGNGN